MHVTRFYSQYLDRHWSVADGNSKPHSLWLTEDDAREMHWRLSALFDRVPEASRYTPMTTQKEQNLWQQ
jgi:hypothetical protein